MNEKISVIVPIYNVEKYLDKCIESITNQTYKNLEIILVNDGSTDNCGNICDRYAEIDSRIKVIHKENGGLSDARNTGLEISTGDIISFVDSDDYIDSEMYQIMVDKLIELNADIIECNINYVFEKEIIEKNILIQKELYENKEAMKELILERTFHQTVWNKLYKRECINKIYFEVGKTNEDEFWTYQVFGNANKIAIINNPLYFYVQRQGSIMNSEYSIKRLDGIEARYERLNYINQRYNSLLKIEKERFLFNCLYHYQQILKSNHIFNKKNACEILERYIKKLDFKSEDMKNISIKNKIWIYLSNISIKYTCIIRNILNIGV